jgi:hypothetical protein
MPKISKIAVFILLTLLFTQPVNAAEIRAFQNFNQLPFHQIFGLPSLDNSPLTNAGDWRSSIVATFSNTYEFDGDDSGFYGSDEEISVDGETHRYSLLLNYAVRDNLQLGVEVPYVKHSGGFLDDFIYEWHDFFGQPQNGRDKDESDEIFFEYKNSDGDIYGIDSTKSGIGDVRLNVAYSRSLEKDRALIYSAEVKLPTGDFDKLTGSGGTDVSIGVTINDPHSLAESNVTLFAGLAAIYLGDIDSDLSDDQYNFAMALRAGMGWQALEKLQLKLQLDGHTPLYDSELEEMGDPALQIVIGGSILFTEDVYLDLAITEDLIVETAPDVGFILALVAKF